MIRVILYLYFYYYINKVVRTHFNQTMSIFNRLLRNHLCMMLVKYESITSKHRVSIDLTKIWWISKMAAKHTMSVFNSFLRNHLICMILVKYECIFIKHMVYSCNRKLPKWLPNGHFVNIQCPFSIGFRGITYAWPL